MRRIKATWWYPYAQAALTLGTMGVGINAVLGGSLLGVIPLIAAGFLYPLPNRGVPDTFVAMDQVTLHIKKPDWPDDWEEGVPLRKGHSVAVSIVLVWDNGLSRECDLVPRGGRPIPLYRTDLAE